MLPFEFIVSGRPVSHQSHNKAKLAAWRRRVRAEAARLWTGASPTDRPLRIAVTFYHEAAECRVDTDNLVKPIQDALQGLVYADDVAITDTAVRKTRIDGAFQIRYESLVLLAAFSKGDEFVHVVIREAPDHNALLK